MSIIKKLTLILLAAAMLFGCENDPSTPPKRIRDLTRS